MPSGSFCGFKLFARKSSKFEEMKSAYLNRSMKMEKQRSLKEVQGSPKTDRQGSQKTAKGSPKTDRQELQKTAQGSPKTDRQMSQKKPQGLLKMDRQVSQKTAQSSLKMQGLRKVDSPRSSAGSFILMMELKKKIFTFRDIIDLPICDGSSSIIEMIVVTMKELHKFYPEIILSQQLSEIRGAPLDKVLIKFSEALKSVGDSWMMNQEWMEEDNYRKHIDIDKSSSEKAVEIALATLNCMIKISKEQLEMMDEELEMMDEDDESKDSPRSSSGSRKSFTGSYSDSSTSCCGSPITPTSVLPQFMGSPTSADLAHLSFSSTLLRSLRVQALGKLNPIDIKRLSFHMPPSAEFLRSLPLKHNIEDEERETNRMSMNDKTNSDEDPMFEVDASTHPEERNGVIVEEAEDSRANNTEMKNIMAPRTSGTACDIKDLLIRPPLLSNIRTSIPDPMLQKTEMPGKQFKSPPPPPPPPATSMLHSHVVACREIPPPPPLHPPSGVMMREQLLPGPLPPPPPPPPPMTSAIVSTAMLPPPPPLLPMTSGKEEAPLQCPPQPLPLPLMKSRTVKEEASLPPLPLPLPIPQASRTATPAAPPPLPLPMMSPTGAMASPPPPPPPRPVGSGAAPPPPPLSMMSSKGGMPPPPPPMSQRSGFAPPPPPLGVVKSLSPNKALTKLRRSSQMGNLYRILKGKVEGVNPNAKSQRGRLGSSAAGSSGGKQGMADALAEIAKRSTYFQQIQEDVQKHAKSITELKTAITTFQTKDMKELIEFHKHVESVLEKLTDETQVLARFEGFPQKKLEGLRMAAALYSKLNGMLTELKNWKIEPPLVQLLDKIEHYFNKIKGDIDALERTKDEELKKFQSQNIHFDFGILLQIKESMVDVSSNCMELALKEKREASAANTEDKGNKIKSKTVGAKMLWRAFQFAFRVYTFAGGHDDRADALTRELAHAIETTPSTQ